MGCTKLYYVIRIAFVVFLCHIAIKILYYDMSKTTKTASPIKGAPQIIYEEPTVCKMHSCFDYDRCSINSSFPVYVYEPYVHADDLQSIEYYFKVLQRNPHVTEERNNPLPCLYLVTVYPRNLRQSSYYISDSSTGTFYIKASKLESLPYWGGDGKNHLIINLSKNILRMDKSLGMAMVAQHTFTESGFRPGFDTVIPTIWPPKTDEESFCPPIKPASRRFLLSFQGSGSFSYDVLKTIFFNSNYNPTISDKLYVQLRCTITKKNQASINTTDWALCGTARLRRIVLEKSTFVLIPAPNHPYITTVIFQQRLYESLKSGAIPVILEGNRVSLPFNEVLDWRRATLLIPEARAPELIYFLNAINDEDILEFRQQGRKLWELYFSSLKGSIDSLLAIIRTKLMIPPPPAEAVYGTPGFNDSYQPPSIRKSHAIILQVVNEPPAVTIKRSFRRNFTTSLHQGYKLWNDWGEPFVMYPQLPWDPVPGDEERFLDSDSKNRLGTNKKPAKDVEKFTIVINSYKRQNYLKKILLKLRGLPFLDKVVIVWNDSLQPANMIWPEVGVPVFVIHSPNNYVQNRFMPYTVLETDAVYLQDDDLLINHSDIISAFRIWQEHRDRIVGCFARHHLGYEFHIEPSNLTSMISTGAAFIHRYYLWAYWRLLPAAIRDHVDIVGLCEDIAMNFLVAHLTKKPPIWVPLNKTNGVLNNYTDKEGNLHRYKKRDYCLQYFTKIMGYMPLLYTETIVSRKTYDKGKKS